jgi:polar amino acid transport system substrate-binding protein
VLDGHFLVIEQTLAIPKGRDTAINYLREFVEEAKASGFVARSLERSEGRNVPVMPRTP